MINLSQGMMVVKFRDLPIGAICQAWVAGKQHLVKKVELLKNGSCATNAKKLEGRKGRVFVWSDMDVELVQQPSTIDELADYEATVYDASFYAQGA